LIHGWPGPVILDHPSALCAKLAAGELDAALVSSFEFLRNPIYRIVDAVAIASDGPVYSVVVANAGEWPFREIELDPASKTSVALLQYLVAGNGFEFHGTSLEGDVLGPLHPEKARLLIGDQAIRFRKKFGHTYRYWDLGEQWKILTGQPFVYALWLVRPEVTEVNRLADQLRAVRDRNLGNIHSIIGQEQEFSSEFCRRYYGDYLRFSLGDPEKRGLHQFAKVCAELQLIPGGKLDLHLV
jgi:chorismate dehydratase